MNLGEMILRERTRAGLSLREVAVAAGLTKPHVWDLETGRATNPTVKSLIGLSRALNVNFGTICVAARITALGLEPLNADLGPGRTPKTVKGESGNG